MADDTKINGINDELVDKTKDLLKIHNALHNKIKDEDLLEKSINNTINDTNDILDSVIDKKTVINDITQDINNSESEIKNNIIDEHNVLTDIVDFRKDELTHTQQTTLEQQKLYGFTSQVLNNLQAALDTQQKLNAAIAAGANTSSTSGVPPTSGNGAPPTSGAPSSPKSPLSEEEYAALNKWYSKGNLAKAAFQGAIDLVMKYGKEAIDKWIEIDHHVYVTGRQIGMTTSQMRGMQKNILVNYSEMANRLGMTFEEIFKFQETYNQSVGRSVILTNKQVESFAGLSKFMGETAVNDMAKNMDNFGASSQTAIDYLTLGMARAANQGLNIKTTSENFAKNIQMASRYTFSKGVDGISKMTLLSQRLKFNMESIGGAIDKFSTIEGAITSSANLQVLGGAYAANYSNPLQAMGEALLDAEGFTQRIVDTVSKTAFFNRDTGMVEMSPIEKAKMREASKIYGINYDELWNMASQQAKIKDIDKYISGKNFNDEQKAFLANTAQYDAATGAWTITKMNEDGSASKPINIANLSSDELSEIQQQNDIEKYIQGDVHAIRNQLEAYLEKSVSGTKSMKEELIGKKEGVAIYVSNIIDDGFFGKGMKDIKDLLKKMSLIDYALLGIGSGILGFLTKNFLGQTKNDIGDFLDGKRKNKGQAKPKTSKPSGGKGGSSVWKRGAKRGITRGGLKMLGKGGGKLLSKLPGIGTIATVLYGGYEAYNAFSQHSDEVEQIKANTSMTQTEKNKAVQKAEKTRNETVGGAVGGVVGSILAGAALGTVVGGPIGTVLGIVGGAAGYYLGDKAGRAIGSSLPTTTNEENVNNTSYSNSSNISNDSIAQTQVNSSILQANESKELSMIQEDVRKIRLDTTANENKFNYSSTIVPRNQYETKTFIRDSVTSNSYHQNLTRPQIDKIDVNISGTLKVQGVGKTQNININEIFETPEFQRMLINKINEGFSKNGNAVQSRSLDTTQSIIGGFYTPNQLNSKN